MKNTKEAKEKLIAKLKLKWNTLLKKDMEKEKEVSGLPSQRTTKRKKN
jgi:hypothetical protein